MALATWSMDRVFQWIQKLNTLDDGMRNAAESAFRDNHIDGETLETVTEGALVNFGIKSFGLRCKLWEAIEELKTSPLDAFKDEEKTSRYLVTHDHKGTSISDEVVFNVGSRLKEDDEEDFHFRKAAIPRNIRRPIQMKLKRMLSQDCLSFVDDLPDFKPRLKSTMAVWVCPVKTPSARMPVRVFASANKTLLDFWDNSGDYIPPHIFVPPSIESSEIASPENEDEVLPLFGDSEDEGEPDTEDDQVEDEREDEFEEEMGEPPANSFGNEEESTPKRAKRIRGEPEGQKRRQSKDDSVGSLEDIEDIDDARSIIASPIDEVIENLNADEVIEAEIERQRQNWHVKELPRLRQKSHVIYRDRYLMADWSKSLTDILDRRLPKLVKSIKDSFGTNFTALRKACENLAPTVESVEEYRWKIDLCRGPIPQPPPSNSTTRKKAASRENTGKSSPLPIEDWSDFIAPEDEDVIDVDAMEVSPVDDAIEVMSNSEDHAGPSALRFGDTISVKKKPIPRKVSRGDPKKSRKKNIHIDDNIVEISDPTVTYNRNFCPAPTDYNHLHFNHRVDELFKEELSTVSQFKKKYIESVRQSNMATFDHNGNLKTFSREERQLFMEYHKYLSDLASEGTTSKSGYGQDFRLLDPLCTDNIQKFITWRTTEILNCDGPPDPPEGRTFDEEGYERVEELEEIPITLDIPNTLSVAGFKKRKRRVLSDDSTAGEGDKEQQISSVYPLKLTTTGSSEKRKKGPCAILSETEESDDSDRSLMSGGNSRERREREESPSKKKGRRDIKSIAPESKFARKSREAREKQEKEFLRRAERHKALLSINNAEKILVNVGDEDFHDPVYLDGFFGYYMKPHQIEGVRFMWKSLIMLKNMDGSRTGSILAHAMGLGKTLQTIAFIYTLCREILRDNISIPEHMKERKILVVAPSIVVDNWKLEFEKWIPEEDLSRVIGYVSVLQGNIFSAGTRLNILKNWSNSFGVLIISYDMFRVLLKPIVNAGATVAESEDEELEDIKATLRKIARDTLVDPGPSLIVCDEAHTIKNPKSMITILANQIKTPSRLCLTGYPLQNKLEEYWCMVNFVHKGYLDTLDDFRNRYSNPIMNGRFQDSTEGDKALAKTQLHTLINLIEPVVLRLDNTPLQMELPPKKEFNIVTRLTTTQHAMYMEYLATFDLRNDANLLGRNMSLAALCNHPDIFLKYQEASIKNSNASYKRLAEEYTLDGDDGDLLALATAEKALSRALGDSSTKVLVDNMKARHFQELDRSDPTLSYKILVIQDIIKGSLAVGDKILIFSTSVETITFLQSLLHKDYRILVITGKTVGNRQKLIDTFNDPDEQCQVFLITTTAGGVGINLVSANRVIIVDFGWNPSHQHQAIARAYRYGQQKPVYVYYILTAGTFEEKLNKNNMSKIELARKVVDKKRSDRIFMKQDLQNYFTAPPENPPSELNPEVDYGDSVLRGVIDKYQDALIKIQSHEEYIEELLDAELTEADKAHIKLAVRTERQRRKMSGRFMQAEELEPDDTVVNSTTEEITNSTVQEIGNSTVQEIANSTVHDLPAGTPQETREKEATDAELKIQLSKTYSDPDDIETALFFLAEGLGL